MISELIETNDNLPLRDVELTRFHSRTAPGISVLDYLLRLAKHAALTPPLLLSMVYYIDRILNYSSDSCCEGPVGFFLEQLDVRACWGNQARGTGAIGT